MTDREKVIKGLEHCSSSDGCKGCPYSKNENGHMCSFDCIRDALALLKEQESVIEALKSDLDETLKVLGEQPEIIRCRECKYGCLMASGKVYMCESPEQNKKICVHVHKPDWFCADGKRR